MQRYKIIFWMSMSVYLLSVSYDSCKIKDALLINSSKLPCALTTIQGGQLGDKLYLYAKAKWFAYKYNIKFLYKPYKYFDQLMLHEYEQNWFDRSDEIYEKKFIIPRRDEAINFIFEDNVFYYVKLSSYDSEWSKYDKQLMDNTIIASNEKYSQIRDKVDSVKDPSCLNKTYSIVTGNDYFDNFYYAVHEDKTFLKQLRNFIKPKSDLKLVSLSPKKISVALHIRKGGEFELYNSYHPQEISLRVPQDEYYIEQIIRLSEVLHDRPLYIFVFTNHTNPSLLVEKLKRTVKKSNIEFDCRKESSDTYILEDIFSMAKFDCLIRPTSSFSRIAQLIGDHKIIIYPIHGVWKKGILKVNQVGVIIKDFKI